MQFDCQIEYVVLTMNLDQEAYSSMKFMVELAAALYGSQEMPCWLVMSHKFSKASSPVCKTSD